MKISNHATDTDFSSHSDKKKCLKKITCNFHDFSEDMVFMK